MPQDQIQVVFTKMFGGYNEGDIATFYRERGEALVKGQVAEPWEAPKKTAKTKTAKDAADTKETEECQTPSPAENQF